MVEERSNFTTFIYSNKLKCATNYVVWKAKIKTIVREKGYWMSYASTQVEVVSVVAKLIVKNRNMIEETNKRKKTCYATLLYECLLYQGHKEDDWN